MMMMMVMMVFGLETLLFVTNTAYLRKGQPCRRRRAGNVHSYRLSVGRASQVEGSHGVVVPLDAVRRRREAGPPRRWWRRWRRRLGISGFWVHLKRKQSREQISERPPHIVINRISAYITYKPVITTQQKSSLGRSYWLVLFIRLIDSTYSDQ